MTEWFDHVICFVNVLKSRNIKVIIYNLYYIKVISLFISYDKTFRFIVKKSARIQWDVIIPSSLWLLLKVWYRCQNTLLSEIFAWRNFRGSQKPQNVCIFAELNFAVHVLEQISRKFNFAVEWKSKFPILIKNNFIKWKERNGEKQDYVQWSVFWK